MENDAMNDVNIPQEPEQREDANKELLDLAHKIVAWWKRVVAKIRALFTRVRIACEMWLFDIMDAVDKKKRIKDREGITIPESVKKSTRRILKKYEGDNTMAAPKKKTAPKKAAPKKKAASKKAPKKN